jgi:hypothetical protein
MVFGQIVIGPPGAGKSMIYSIFLDFSCWTVGKTTYCFGIQQFTEQIERKCAIINLDFANDTLPYTPAIDVRKFINLQVGAATVECPCLSVFL